MYRTITSLVAFTILIVAGQAPALDFTWDGSANNDNWYTASNWTPYHPGFIGGPPVDGNKAIIPINDLIRLTGSTAPIDGLTMSNSADIFTNGRTLNVSNPGNTAVTTVSGNGTQIFVNSEAGFGFDFVADIVNLTNGGELDMTGGGAIPTNRLSVDSASRITGYGTIGLVNGPPGPNQVLILDGRVRPDSGLLTILATGGGTLNLDGTAGNGFLDVTSNGDLTISGPLSDWFSGRMDIGNNNTVKFEQAYSHDGDLNFTASHANRLEVPSVSFNSGENVTVNQGTGRIVGTNTWNNGSSLHVALTTVSRLVLDGFTQLKAGSTMDVDGTLDLEGFTEMFGATITGDGVVNQMGNAQIRSDTTIDVSVYNMDGVAPSNMNLLGDLTLNVDRIDSSNNVYDGEITFNSFAKLTVNLPGDDSWEMAGTAKFNGTFPELATNSIAGSDFEMSGVTQLNGDGGFGWSARADISGQVVTNGADSSLALYGGSLSNPNRMTGGTIVGGGRVVISNGKALVGHGFLNVNVAGAAGELREDDGVLTVDEPIDSIGVIGTNDTDGVLNVTLPWDTGSAGLVEMKGGSIIGDTITNSGMLKGFGTISAKQIHNSGGTIAAEGGTLIIDTTQNPNLDGGVLGFVGLVEAFDGDLLVVSPLSDAFNATLNVGENRSVTFQSGWTLNDAAGSFPFIQPRGVLNLNGGASPSTAATIHGSQNLNGDVNVDLEAGFHAPTTFDVAVHVDLPHPDDVLRMCADSVIRFGANFTGDVQLVNTNGNTMSLRNNSTLGVALVNQGVIRVGNSPGIAVGADYVQTSDGKLIMEIGGLTPGTQHDRISFNRPASLAGTLQISLINGFVPNYFDEFRIMSYDTHDGKFEDIVGAFVNSSMTLAPIYTDTDLSLVAALPGDGNLDGVVNFADFALVSNNFNLTNRCWKDGDYNLDGNTNFEDFAVLSNNFGQMVPAPTMSAAAAPEPTALALVCLGTLA